MVLKRASETTWSHRRQGGRASSADKTKSRRFRCRFRWIRGMKQEYDFSKAVRGKFFREGAELQLPIESLRHLRSVEDDVQSWKSTDLQGHSGIGYSPLDHGD